MLKYAETQGSFCFYFPLRSFQEGLQTLIEIDTAMVSLRKVSGETLEAVKEFSKEATEIGIALGRTTKEVLDSATAWARLGYNIRDAKILAQESLLLSNVGLMDTTQADRHLISTIKAYRIEIDEQGKNIRQVVDMVNEVGNRFAISQEGIGKLCNLPLILVTL